jgi:GT2 family glycosyltransferase
MSRVERKNWDRLVVQVLDAPAADLSPVISDPVTMGKAGRLVAVVVTYNRCDQLQVTLARLLSQPTGLLQAVVVVDNASTDDTAPWLTTQSDPRLIVHHNRRNMGGAGGFATGMQLAMQRFDPDWLVVMDDDARPMAGALARFHHLDLAQWDAVAAAVYQPDGTVCKMNRPSRNPFWLRAGWGQNLWRMIRGLGRTGLRLEPPALGNDGPAQRVDLASFVGFFIRGDAVRRIGYPDPDMFIYGDDGFYTLGLSKAGGRIGFQPIVQFEHDCTTFDEGSPRHPRRFTALWKVYFYHRNLLMLYHRAAGRLFWLALPVELCGWLWQLRAHAGERRAFLALFWLALKDGLRGQTGRSREEIEQRIARIQGERAEVSPTAVT